MLDIIGSAFSSKYQILLIKLILSIFIILFEISFSQIPFFYQKTPYIFYAFIYFWFSEIGILSYWVYFFIGLFYDLIFGNNLGLSTISLLLIAPILTLTTHISKILITQKGSFVYNFYDFLLSLKYFLFYIIFKIPEIEFIIFQILITLIFIHYYFFLVQ